MTPSKMLELSRAVSDKLAEPSVAGAVVTHGTDTLEETAYLLDIVLAEDKQSRSSARCATAPSSAGTARPTFAARPSRWPRGPSARGSASWSP